MSDTITYPPTKAQRHLADNEAAMLASLDALRAAMVEEAAEMTKAQLIQALAETPRSGIKAPTASATKALWEGAWVEMKVRTSLQQKEHNDARYAVAEEQAVDAAVQALVDEADGLVTKLRAELAKGDADITTLAYWLEWNASEAPTLAEAVYFARQWQGARARGFEPRELATIMTRDCLRQLLTFTGSSNLKVSGHGIAEAAKASGPKRFLRAIARLVTDEVLPGLF